MTINKKIDYLFSKINWKDSPLDGKAIEIMNSLKQDVQVEINEPLNRLNEGRDYLMQVGDYDFNIEDCFEAFGFERSGLNKW